MSGHRRAIFAYTPLLLLMPMAGLVLPIALMGVVVTLASRAQELVDAVRSPGFTAAGRAVVAVLVLIALPGFVAAAADIFGRGP